jgi:CRISPR/Cas system-associated exonuclease Cas4 (RecB family)
MTYGLSATKMNLLKECPRCFWLLIKKNIKRPSRPMSSIPIKIDSIIKKYFNSYRGIQLPPILNRKINGQLAVGMPQTLRFDTGKGIILWGRPDDYITLEDFNIAVLDHKTRSQAPKTVHPSYQLQMDFYSYLLKKNGYKTINKAYLTYFTPDYSILHNGLTINCSIFEVTTNSDHIEHLISIANKILNGPRPVSDENCEYCRYTQAILENESNLKDV